MASRLANTQSPYLRSHADNPVEWFPWGPEAFEVARRRDVPVLVSIGYSTCHWCHVMARESFSDPDTAARINAGFVAIKVDREEHPDVDAAFLAAASAFTPHLGWPLTVFTTPAGRAFFAGTYFPPEARSGIPAFRDVLAAVGEAWDGRRDEVDATAAAVADALSAVGAAAAATASVLPDESRLAEAARALLAQEDREFGGFGAAPKFPVATALRFLQAPVVRRSVSEARSLVARALAAMASSPLRDAVEGGFFRYATQRDWSVPHFERMLVDNAQLLDVATDVGAPEIAEGIASFLVDVLQQPSGGFGSAQDSESWIAGERSEGGYYARDAAARAQLEAPAVDAKVVTGWNGLAIAALARSGARWDRPDWIASARWAAEAVIENNVGPDDVLLRASLDEIPSRAAATLADYGQFASGLFALALASGEVAYAVRARDLLDACISAGGAGPGEVAVPGGGDPTLKAHGLAAPADATDGDQPSAVSAFADAALRAWMLGAGESYRAVAEALTAPRAADASSRPLAYGALLRAAAQLAAAPRQLVVVTDDPDAPLAAAARAVDADVTAIVTPDQADAFARAGFALFDAKIAQGGAPTAYDCRGFACRLPTTNPDELRRDADPGADAGPRS